MRALFIGDEVTAAGYRLAGLGTRLTDADGAAEALREVGKDATLILIGAGVATAIDEDGLAAARANGKPLIVIVPDATGGEPPDLGAMVNRAFGLES